MAKTVKNKYERTHLNSKQVVILELVYKYRFVSRQLISESLGVDQNNGIYRSLEILAKHDYLGKRFDKSLKLLGTPASYYLTPKGLRALRSESGHEFISEATIKSSYKDRTVSQQFIAHSLAIYRYTNLLQAHYRSLKVFTKRDMDRYSSFPPQPPDAFLSMVPPNSKHPARFFLDIVSDTTPRYAIEKRIAGYCRFFSDGSWDDIGSLPATLLLVCAWAPAERRMQRSIRALYNNSNDDGIAAYTTTIPALDNMAENPQIWTDLENQELQELNHLP